MKKIIIILVLIVFLIIAFVIDNRKIKPFYLDEEYYNNTSINEISTNELNDLETSKGSFAIFIYDPYCPTSLALNNILNEFTTNYQVSIYKISFANIGGTTISKYVKYCPSVVIYQKGEIVSYLNSNAKRDTIYFESLSQFIKWFTKYILLYDYN